MKVYNTNVNRASGGTLPAGRQGYTRKSKMYYVYILKSKVNGSYYKGLTSDIDRRIRDHNSGNTSSNRKFAPYGIVHVELCENLEDARELELFFKSGYGRELIKEIDEISGQVAERYTR